MRKFITVHLVLRFVPIALLCLLLLLDYLLEFPEGRALRLCCYLLAAAIQYVAYPLTREDTANPVRFFVVSSLYYLCAFMMQRGKDMADFYFLIPGAVFSVVYLVGALILKYEDAASVFRKDAAWCCAEEDSRTFYVIIILGFTQALIVMRYEQALPTFYWIVAALIAGVNILLHIRAYSGRTMLIGKRKERRIQSLIVSNGHMSDIVPEVENTILARAYRRIDQFMRDSKPYLDEKFTLEKMSDVLKLNKLYISRSINKFTNKNFRQYVNWHRVMYSVELMRADPWLKVIEIAFMSGFHSQVTFNMCFKLFLDETPSDMLSRLRLLKPRPEVSKIEVTLPQGEVAPSLQDARS